MPLSGQPVQAMPWSPLQARVGPTLLQANSRLQDQLRSIHEELMLKAWPEQSRNGLTLQAQGTTAVQLTAGTHVDPTGVVWRWQTQTLEVPAAAISQVYFLCADRQGQLAWRVRVPAETLTVLGYILLDATHDELVALRAVRTLSWSEHDESGRLLRAYEGLHDWKVREEFYQYDAQGRIREILVTEPEKTHRARYAFDEQNRLVEVRRSTTRTEPFVFNGLYRLNGALFLRGVV